jgi:hypothetical protein
MGEPPFIRRYGLSAQPVGVLTYEDAPIGLRNKLFEILSASKRQDLNAFQLRDIACQVMDVRPDPNPQNSFYTALAMSEAQQLVYECKWFQFYGIIEEIAQVIRKADGVGTALVRRPQEGSHLRRCDEYGFRKVGSGLANC